MNTETPPILPHTPAPVSRPRKWLKRLGWAFVWIVTLAVLAIAVENHLGARAWQAAVAEVRAAGEPTEPAQMIPPPATDAENFAAIPLFKPLFDYDPVPPGKSNVLTSPHWRDPEGKARVEALKLPSAREPGNFRRGQFVDLTVWQRALEKTDEPGTPAAAVLGALRKFDPELDALREAAKRPRSRFSVRYEDHVAAALPHISVILNFTRIATLRAVAELAEGDVEAAHGDLLLCLALEEAPREEPLLISPLVRAASLETLLQPLWEGLVRRQWTDAQLASLDAALQRPDFVASFQASIRGERLIFCTQALDAIKKDPALLTAMTAMDGGANRPWSVRAIGWLVPGGWIDFNKAALSRGYLDLAHAADPQLHRFFPGQMDRIDQDFVREVAGHRYNPRRAIASLVFPAVSTAGQRFASTQASIDLARTAIALERYRLAHGAWPASLSVLPALPTDVIGGAPLHYRLEQDGTFTLYSIGWNERDDGGVTAWKAGTSPAVNWKEGDWVWPAYPRPELVK
ncbi:MAG TPA: hypothetical protein VGO11_15000 [Chthoniobacteraceae bacterium]|jgi:hypothetical protein|nr:hypothetical protein [Chthoniobacteraceae bacterium]